jgi:hypothetical protein
VDPIRAAVGVVMPALGAGIHVFLVGTSAEQDVDGRDKPGHDAEMHSADAHSRQHCILLA